MSVYPVVLKSVSNPGLVVNFTKAGLGIVLEVPQVVPAGIVDWVVGEEYGCFLMDDFVPGETTQEDDAGSWAPKLTDKFLILNLQTAQVVSSAEDFDEAGFRAGKLHITTDMQHMVLQNRGVSKVTKTATIGEA